MTKQQDFSMWSVNFILFCLANFLYYGAFYLYIPVLPQYVEMLGGTPADIGLVGGAFGLSSFIIRPYLGKLANEWGRKRMMLLGAISLHCCFCCSAELPAWCRWSYSGLRMVFVWRCIWRHQLPI